MTVLNRFVRYVTPVRFEFYDLMTMTICMHPLTHRSRTDPVRRSRTVLVLLTTALLLLGGLTVTTSQAAAGQPEFTNAVNAERGTRGLPALATSGDLAAVAQRWSDHMASTGTLAHNPQLSQQVSGWRSIGENVGVGGSELQIHEALMASPGHRANILNTQYGQIGIGITHRNGRVWVTQVFRQPAGPTAAPIIPNRPSAVYKAPHSPNIYWLDNGQYRHVSGEQWAVWGHPTPQPAPTAFVRYPWSTTVYAVTFWSGGWQWERLSYDQWRYAGFPAVGHAGWIAGSTIFQHRGSPAIYVTDPDGATHQLSYSEWAATPFRQPQAR